MIGYSISKWKVINNQIQDGNTDHPKLRHAAPNQTHGTGTMDLEHGCGPSSQRVVLPPTPPW